MGKYFHVEVREDLDEEEMARRIQGTGTGTNEVREMTAVQDGVSVTQNLAERIWNMETGSDDCSSRCRKHRKYQDLYEGQKDSFIENLVEFMNSARAEQYSPASLRDEDGFEYVALERHG